MQTKNPYQWNVQRRPLSRTLRKAVVGEVGHRFVAVRQLVDQVARPGVVLNVGDVGRPGWGAGQPKDGEDAGDQQVDHGKERIRLVVLRLGDVHKLRANGVEEAEDARGDEKLRRGGEVNWKLLRGHLVLVAAVEVL